TGKGRPERLATLDRLGARLTATGGKPDNLSAEESIEALTLQKAELSTQKGPNHPDILAIDARIRKLTALQKLPQGGGELDELDRHRLKLEADRDSLIKNIDYLENVIAEDEQKATNLFGLQEDIDHLKQRRNRKDDQIKEKTVEKNLVMATLKG